MDDDMGDPAADRDRSLLGHAIRQMREAARLSQRELGERLRVDPTYISHLEAGRRDPSLALLRKLSRELSVPLALFLAGVLSEEVPDQERTAYDEVTERFLEIARSRQLELSLDRSA